MLTAAKKKLAQLNHKHMARDGAHVYQELRWQTEDQIFDELCSACQRFVQEYGSPYSWHIGIAKAGRLDNELAYQTTQASVFKILEDQPVYITESGFACLIEHMQQEAS